MLSDVCFKKRLARNYSDGSKFTLAWDKCFQEFILISSVVRKIQNGRNRFGQICQNYSRKCESFFYERCLAYCLFLKILESKWDESCTIKSIRRILNFQISTFVFLERHALSFCSAIYEILNTHAVVSYHIQILHRNHRIYRQLSFSHRSPLRLL